MRQVMADYSLCPRNNLTTRHPKLSYPKTDVCIFPISHNTLKHSCTPCFFSKLSPIGLHLPTEGNLFVPRTTCDNPLRSAHKNAVSFASIHPSIPPISTNRPFFAGLVASSQTQRRLRLLPFKSPPPFVFPSRTSPPTLSPRTKPEPQKTEQNRKK